ncbi:MAG: tetratricopeptide repeat protein [Candidatus Eiseniibacteriota bacterium]
MEDAKRLTLALGVACTLVALAVAGSAGAAGDSTARASSLLAEARVAAGQDRHADAIEAAMAALELSPELESDAALLIAHQMTWADRPADAVRWYERHLGHHPGDREGELGLARALAWSGDLEAADEVYASVLARAPDDVEARLGTARMRAWAEDHGAAAELYGAVLADEPSSREAKLGLADAENARGRHRRAIALYREMLATDPDDEEARVGLARAYAWSGLPDRAEQELGPLESDAAADLRAGMARDRRTTATAFASRWTDVDDEELLIVGARVDASAALRTRVFAEVVRERAEQPLPGELFATRATLGAGRVFSQAVEAHLAGTLLRQSAGSRAVDVGGGVILNDEDIEGTDFLADGWVTLRPADWTRVDLGWARVHVPTARALAHRIRVNVLSLGVDRRLSDVFVARIAGSRADHSDRNERWSASAEVEAAPLPARDVTFGAGVSWFDFAEVLDHGYYNPERYDALFATAAVGQELGAGWRIALDGRIASERENRDDRFGVFAGGAELGWSSPAGVGFSVFARKSTSRFDTAGGYEREGVGVSLFASR